VSREDISETMDQVKEIVVASKTGQLPALKRVSYGINDGFWSREIDPSEDASDRRVILRAMYGEEGMNRA